MDNGLDRCRRCGARRRDHSIIKDICLGFIALDNDMRLGDLCECGLTRGQHFVISPKNKSGTFCPPDKKNVFRIKKIKNLDWMIENEI